MPSLLFFFGDVSEKMLSKIMPVKKLSLIVVASCNI